MLIAATVLCFVLSAVFAVLWFLSRTPYSNVRTAYSPGGFQLEDLSNDRTGLQPHPINVPDVFDEARIKSDLQRLESQPTLLAQYIAQAETRFSQARQMAVLQRWTEFYQVGEQVIVARTKLARAHHDFLQVNREGEIKAKEKDVRIKELEAQLAEAALREAQAKLAQHHLGKAPPIPEPALSAEERRILSKARVENEIGRLRTERLRTVEMDLTEEEKIRMLNRIDDRIYEREEELAKYL